MSKARMAAEALVSDYFAGRGESCPESDAKEIIAKVRIVDQVRWFPRKYVDDAIAIIRKAAFDIDDLAKNFLGIDVKVAELTKYDSLTGAPVYGLAHPTDWAIHVCRRATDYKPLYRATVAHEIGHLQLHSAVAAFSPESRKRPPVESEADDFMHNLLAQPNVLQMSVALVSHLYGIRFDQVMGGANLVHGRYLWKTRVLPVLVNNLCVSRQMLCLKFVRMGILNQESYEWHLSYAMPNVWLAASRSKPLGYSLRTR